ncbi:MAG: XRE family transcriptional regulator [Nitrospirae bacterium]|nr:MAG: XRE family transcriptional regulator [Nitrospirota bacterium]
MNIHWTAQNTENFLFKIAADFVNQLEDKMEMLGLSQDAVAKKLGLSKGRVSQFINNPGNLTLKKIIEYSRALNMKVSIMAYDDNDPDNAKGPINPDIFRICWEKAGKPHDFWAFEETTENQDMDLVADNQQFIYSKAAANDEGAYIPRGSVTMFSSVSLGLSAATSN